MTATKHCLVGALLALAVPLLASAAPAPVTGVHAERRGAEVVVSWDATSSDVASYRVYWSRQSILDNDGDYDDSEQTDGPVTTLTLKKMADGPVFVAVIAVDSNGEESAAFVEEAEATTADNRPVLQVTRVVAAGANQIRLTFDHAVVLALADIRQAVRVEDANGTSVAVVSLSLDEDTILLTTAEQRAGKYRVTLAQEAFLGLPSDEGGPLAVFTQDSVHPFTSLAVSAPTSSSSMATRSSTRSSLTTAASSTISTATTSSAESDSSAPPILAPTRSSSSAAASASSVGPAVTVTLKDLPRTDGFHDIEIGWTITPGAEVSELSLAQSVDGGRTFGAWQPVPPGLGLVRVNRIPAGTFAVLLAAFAPDGSTYEPALQTITLSGRVVSGGMRPPVASTTNGNTPLASSGPASIAFVIALVAGGLAGAARLRRVPAAR